MKHRIDDDFLYHHMPEAEPKLIGDVPPHEGSEHRFSLRFRWKMHRLLGRKLRWKKRPTFSARKLALSLAAVLFLLIGIFMSSEAARARFLKFIVQRFPRYTEIRMESDAGVSNDGVEPIDPSYVPEGYRESEKILNDMVYRVSYINEEGLELRYNESLLIGTTHVDTEDADVETVLMEGLELMTIEKNGNVMIYWHDDRYQFWLDGEVEKEELLQMAESIIKK